MWSKSGKPRAETVEKAAGLIRDKRYPEAVAILSGGVHGAGYDPGYYELLGQSLLGIGQQEQAGRFLFLSGARRPEYAIAIETFVRMNSGGHFRQLHSKFTFAARTKWRLDRFPQALADDLRRLGFPENIQEEHYVTRIDRRNPREAKPRKELPGGLFRWFRRLLQG
jgi:hypothetical protein